MSENRMIAGMEARLKELISGKTPNNFSEKLFVKGYQDALAEILLTQSYLEIGDTEDLEELDRKLFLLGYSVGLDLTRITGGVDV